MNRARAATAAIALVLGAWAACGNGTLHEVPDAARPAIDPAPYYTNCLLSDPASCPAPYECTVPDLAHDPPSNVCLVPCESDRDCPDNNFCNGVRMSAETGASYHCATNP